MADSPEEFGRRLAEQHTPDLSKAVIVTLLGRVLKMLIADGLLNEGKVIAEIEQTAAEVMSDPSGPTAVSFLQIVRDIIEG